MYFDGEMYFPDEVDERVEIEEETSIDELSNKFDQLWLPFIDDGDIPSLFLAPEDRQKRIEDLGESVKELKARSAQATEETKKQKEKSNKYEAELKCVVCDDVIRNPYSLECGHSACYLCLRVYWTKVTVKEGSAPIVSTDEEDCNNDLRIVRRRRHQFSSVVNQNKTCPSCGKLIQRRPSPNYRVQHMTGIIDPDLHTVPGRIQPRLSTHRKDPWRGIFSVPRDPQVVVNHFFTMDPYARDLSMHFTSEEVNRLRRMAHMMVAHFQLELVDAQEHERELALVLEGLERNRNAMVARRTPSAGHSEPS